MVLCVGDRVEELWRIESLEWWWCGCLRCGRVVVWCGCLKRGRVVDD